MLYYIRMQKCTLQDNPENELRYKMSSNTNLFKFIKRRKKMSAKLQTNNEIRKVSGDQKKN